MWALARFFVNTVFVTVFSVSGRILSAALVAYGFAALPLSFPQLPLPSAAEHTDAALSGHNHTDILLFKAFGWLDTYNPLIIPNWFGGGAFAIFLFRQFFLTIPKDLDEAAK